jgi:hypothetical protein
MFLLFCPATPVDAFPVNTGSVFLPQPVKDTVIKNRRTIRINPVSFKILSPL